MSKKTVFESVNMASTKNAARIYDVVADSEIENGTFGYIEELATNESVIYTFHKGTKAGATVVVADQPAWVEDAHRTVDQRKDKFTIEAGVVFRAREVKKGDEFGITIEGVTSATTAKAKVGAFVTIDATTGKLVASDKTAVTESSSPVMEAKIMRTRTLGAKIITTAHTYGESHDMYEAKVTILA